MSGTDDAARRPAAAPRPRSLFRQEAIDAQREKLLGEVSQARPLPMWVFTALAAAVAAALIAFAFLGGYTRRERVEGYLELDQGAARVSAPEAAVVSKLLVNEGDAVTAGQVLAQLSLERTTGSGVNASEYTRQQVRDRLNSIDSEANQEQQLAGQEAAQVAKKVDDLKREIEYANQAVTTQEDRLASAQQQFERARELVKENLYSEAKLHDSQNDVLEQQAKLQDLRSRRTSLQRELSASQADLPLTRLRMQTKQQQLAQRKSELAQALVQEEARGDVEVKAPIDGVVTNIEPARGDSLRADATIATVMPKGSGLHARLLVPTRAIGFIQPGNPVVLRYDAYPFQRFGQYRGKVSSVSLAVVAAGETVGPMVAKEPVYRVDVTLESQHVRWGEQEYPLRPGINLSADILLEKRSIFEWVFEPVLGLRERLR